MYHIIGLKRKQVYWYHQTVWQNLPLASSLNHSKSICAWKEFNVNCVGMYSTKFIMCVSVSHSSALDSMGDLDDSESSSDASEEEDQQDRRPVSLYFRTLSKI